MPPKTGHRVPTHPKRTARRIRARVRRFDDLRQYEEGDFTDRSERYTPEASIKIVKRELEILDKRIPKY